MQQSRKVLFEWKPVFQENPQHMGTLGPKLLPRVPFRLSYSPQGQGSLWILGHALLHAIPFGSDGHFERKTNPFVLENSLKFLAKARVTQKQGCNLELP